jgi:hypothetical protein
MAAGSCNFLKNEKVQKTNESTLKEEFKKSGY